MVLQPLHYLPRCSNYRVMHVGKGRRIRVSRVPNLSASLQGFAHCPLQVLTKILESPPKCYRVRYHLQASHDGIVTPLLFITDAYDIRTLSEARSARLNEAYRTTSDSAVRKTMDARAEKPRSSVSLALGTSIVIQR